MQQKGPQRVHGKPLTADGLNHGMLKLGGGGQEPAVGVGPASRQLCRALQELHQRIQEGEIGEINLMRGYRLQAYWPGPFHEVGLPARRADVADPRFQLSGPAAAASVT